MPSILKMADFIWFSVAREHFSEAAADANRNARFLVMNKQ